MKSKEDFLFQLNTKLRGIINSDSSFNYLYNLLQKGKINLYKKTDVSQIEKQIKIIKDLLNKVVSIIYKPLMSSSFKDSILRSEKSGPLSASSFKETTKDARLWKDKEGDMSPEYVHSLENEDTIDIYENRFIVLFINFLEEKINDLVNLRMVKIPCIEDHYQTNLNSYSSFGVYNDFYLKSYPISEVLDPEFEDIDDTYKGIFDLEKKIKKLKSTHFYKLLSDRYIDRNVIPTSILLHNDLYFACYHFYKSNTTLNEANDVRNKYYYNYFLLNLFLAISKENNIRIYKINDIQLKIIDKKLHFTSFSLRRGNFKYTFREDEKEMGIHVDIELIMGGNNNIKDILINNTFAHYYIYVSHYFSDLNKREVLNKLFEYKNEVNSEILITNNNTVHQYNNILNLSYLNKNNELLMINLIKSFVLLFRCNKDIYVDTCPICGSKNVLVENVNHECLGCHGSYSIININNKDLVWVKALRRF